MIIFNFLINLVESVLFSLFVGKYLEIGKLQSYIAFTTILQILFLNLANFYHYDGILLTIGIMGIMIGSTCLWKKKMTFELVFVVLLYNTFIFIAAFLGTSVATFIQSLFSLSMDSNYVMRCLMAKCIQCIGTCLVLKYNYKLTLNMELNQWSSVIFLYCLLLILIGNEFYSIITNQFTLHSTLISLMLSFVIAVIFGFIIDKINTMNKKKEELLRMEQIEIANEEKLSMMKHIRNEMSITDHRMFYMFMRVEQYLEVGQYERAKSLIHQYKNAMMKYRLVIDTNNPIFDCFYSLKVNEMILSGQNIENMILISEHNLYNDVHFNHFFSDLLDLFKQCQKLMISLNEIGELLIVKIVYRDGEINEDRLTQLIQNYARFIQNANITNHQQNGIRLSIGIDENED